MKNVKIIRCGLMIVVSLSFLPSFVLSIDKISTAKQSTSVGADGTLSAEIKRQLFSNQLSLYFPNSVKRFYQNNNFNSPWIKPQSGAGSTWQAMMLIDCVLQYGLSHDDYHPKELVYDELHSIMEKPGTIAIKKQARFDIMLTDAMLNFINNLHFGKFNPDYPARKVDNLETGFQSGNTLTEALAAKSFIAAITNVQPKTIAYADMQYHMRQWTGLYTGDCYEIPESSIRKLAINMERLRWANIDTGAYIQVNIPSYTLSLVEPDSTYTFNVVVGKPLNATPALQSQVRYFTTATRRKALVKKPVIRFGFPNVYSLSLYGTPEQLIKKQELAITEGDIGIEYAENLAVLLLQYDHAGNRIPALHKVMARNQTLNFRLIKPVPIKITYLTCMIKEGNIIEYKDIYNLDNRLEMAFYNVSQEFTVR